MFEIYASKIILAKNVCCALRSSGYEDPGYEELIQIRGVLNKGTYPNDDYG